MKRNSWGKAVCASVAVINTVVQPIEVYGAQNTRVVEVGPKSSELVVAMYWILRRKPGFPKLKS